MPEPPGDFQKVALVTGGSRGLGLEMARILARRGWQVAIVARERGRLEEARRSIVAEMPLAAVLVIGCDLEQEGSARIAVERAFAEFGRIDLLVNNAGAISPAPFVETTRDAIARSLALHVLAPAEAMQAAWPIFAAQGSGRVVNVSAIEGLVGVPTLSACATGKFGLVGLSESVRAEWASRGVAITLACPGFLRPIDPGRASGADPASAGLPDWARPFVRSSLVAMDVRRAAALVLDASDRGRPRVVLTALARALAFLGGIAPRLTSRLAASAGRRLWRDPAVAG